MSILLHQLTHTEVTALFDCGWLFGFAVLAPLFLIDRRPGACACWLCCDHPSLIVEELWPSMLQSKQPLSTFRHVPLSGQLLLCVCVIWETFCYKMIGGGGKKNEKEELLPILLGRHLAGVMRLEGPVKEFKGTLCLERAVVCSEGATRSEGVSIGQAGKAVFALADRYTSPRRLLIWASFAVFCLCCCWICLFRW